MSDPAELVEFLAQGFLTGMLLFTPYCRFPSLGDNVYGLMLCCIVNKKDGYYVACNVATFFLHFCQAWIR